MENQNLYSYIKCLKRNKLLTCCNMDKPHKDIMLHENKQDHIIYDSIYRNGQKVDWCLPAGVGRKELPANGHKKLLRMETF